MVSLEDLRRGEFHENTVRKNFTVSEMVAIERYFEPIIEETRIGHRLSKEEEEKGDNLAPFPKGKTREIVAAYSGVSHGTLKKARTIVEAAEKKPKFIPLLERLNKGMISVNAAHIQVRRAEKHSKAGEPLADSASGMGRVKDKIASFAGTSRDTLRKAEDIVEAIAAGFGVFCLTILSIKAYGFFRREKKSWD